MKKEQGKDTLVSGKSKPAEKAAKKDRAKMRKIVKGLKVERSK